MKDQHPSHRRSFVLRRLVSAVVWLAVPSLTLLAFASSSLKALFRPQPFNMSYDATFIAGTAGVGVTSLWILSFFNGTLCEKGTRPLPVFCSWRNASDLFELFASASPSVAYVAAGAPSSGPFWLVSLVLLVISTWSLSKAEKDVNIERRSEPTRLSRTASALLVVVALLFIAFPVLQPWCGPLEGIGRDMTRGILRALGTLVGTVV